MMIMLNIRLLLITKPEGSFANNVKNQIMCVTCLKLVFMGMKVKACIVNYHITSRCILINAIKITKPIVLNPSKNTF